MLALDGQEGRAHLRRRARCPATGACGAANVVSHSAPVATQCPHAAGIGLAIKLRGEDKVVLTTIGEGSTSQGEWYEAVNWAAIHQLPVIFLVQNNQYAISVPPDKQMAVPSCADKACGLGLPGVSVDGTDVFAVYQIVARSGGPGASGEGPTLVEARMYRITPHSSDDDDRTYRSREEVEEHKKSDPLRRPRRLLEEEGLLTPTSWQKWKPPKQMVEEAVQYRRTGAPTRMRKMPRSRCMPRRCAMAEMTLIEAIRQAMDEELARDARVFIIGEDVGVRGGVFRATVGLLDKYGGEPGDRLTPG